MIFQRTVTYEVAADSLEEAIERWECDGPECGTRVSVAASSNLERVDDLELGVPPP